MISAEIIADSINVYGKRITTLKCVFPRYILAEFNTHRAFSRNSASSRAIPFKKMIKMVNETPFVPYKWMKEHPGMQGTEYITGELEIKKLIEQWLHARDHAVICAERMSNLGLTKQLCNRILEPFLYHTVVVTATEWENFFAQRAHKGADIHMQLLAEKMLSAINESIPLFKGVGQWHLPFGNNIDDEKLLEYLYNLNNNKFPIFSSVFTQAKVEICTARCARTSYLNFEGSEDYKKDLILTNGLVQNNHWSPLEHCAQVGEDGLVDSGNFKGGWIQYRKTFSQENQTDKRILTKYLLK